MELHVEDFMERQHQHGDGRTHLPVKEAEYGGHQETLQEERFGSP